MNGSHKRGSGTGGPWSVAGMGLLIFGCLYAFFSWTGDAMGSLFALTMALAVTAYTLMTGRVIKHQFQISGAALLQLLTLFLLGHFLPFVLDDVGNPHLFYGADLKRLAGYILSGLLNFILCGIFLTRDRRKLGIAGRLLWRLAVCFAIFLNPFQAVILLSLLCVDLFFAVLAQIREKASLKTFLAVHRETLLWIAVWFASVALELMDIWGRDLTGEIIGTTGLFDCLRTLRESVLNMVPLFHGSVIVMNLAAIAFAVFRWLWHRETGFLYWLLKMLLCMLFTAGCLVLLSTLVGDRYLVRTEVMLCWMGWLLLMTVSSLAYLLQKLPQAQWLLPLLTYMAICETILNFRSYAVYVFS